MTITLNSAARKAVLRLTDGGNPVRISDHFDTLKTYVQEAGYTDWVWANEDSKSTNADKYVPTRFERACMQAASVLARKGILYRCGKGTYVQNHDRLPIYILRMLPRGFQLTKRVSHDQEKVIANFGRSSEAYVIREATLKAIKDNNLGRVLYA